MGTVVGNRHIILYHNVLLLLSGRISETSMVPNDRTNSTKNPTNWYLILLFTYSKYILAAKLTICHAPVAG